MKPARLDRIRTDLIRIYRKTLKLLRSQATREFGVFLCFFILAACFWLLLSLKDTTEGEFDVELRYRLPERSELTNRPPRRLHVRLRDRGSVLMQYFVNGIPPVTVDCGRYAGESGIARIGFNQLAPRIREQLYTTTSLQAMTPDTVSVYYTNLPGKRVPLEVPRLLSARPHCRLDSVLSLSSDSVTVFAPPSILMSLRTMETDSLVATALSDTLRRSLTVRPVAGVRVVPETIEATVFVEEITTKTFDLPVVAKGLPRGLTLLAFPARAELSCMMGLSEFSKVTEADFEIGIDYRELLRTPGRKQPLVLYSRPDFVQHIRFEPDSVEYILEEQLP